MYLKLTLPPGLAKDGTEYQAGGSWWDMNLCRWYELDVGPIGGWQKRSNFGVTGLCRQLLGWESLTGAKHLIGGTHLGLFHQALSGTVVDITPVGFVDGIADSIISSGYGASTYGTGLYGVARAASSITIPASTWDMDTFGQIPVMSMQGDGNLYEWDLDVTHKATVITGAPTDCQGCFVTNQRAVVAYGAGGDGRNVAWSDLEDRNDWTPSAINQAGDFDLTTDGTIVKGLRLGDDNLLVTTVDAHMMRYIGPPFIYSFERIQTGCGAMSKGAVVNVGLWAVWWGRSAFYRYSGGVVDTVPCTVLDFLRTNLNRNQRAKISGGHNPDFNEVWWFYPSAGANECDSYVSWNYGNGTWARGRLSRLAVLPKGVFENPLMVDDTGIVWEHELSSGYHSEEPYVETGPIELDPGERVMQVNGVIPDERTVGQSTLKFYYRDLPNAEEEHTEDVDLTARGYSDLRFAARELRMRITFLEGTSCRFGAARIDLQPGGGR